MSKMKNFRLSAEDQVILDALASDWRMSERAVVSELLRKNDPRGGVHVEPDPEFKGGPRGTKAASAALVARERLDAEIESVSRPVQRPMTATEAVERTSSMVEQANMRLSTGGMKRRVEIPIPDWKKGPVPERSGFTPVPKRGKK